MSKEERQLLERLSVISGRVTVEPGKTFIQKLMKLLGD
jgi:hypothetical protein